MYNVEKYVEKCILSCINQRNFPISDYEIIVINDGSPDRSIDIINNVDWKGVSHKVISQNNMGLSMARNNGLDVAEGEYVWFIDSDDWISDNALSIISRYLKHGIDAISINAADVNGNSVIPRFNFGLDLNKIYSGKFLIKKHKWYCAVPFTVYKKEFLKNNHLNFKAGIFHEDMEFTPRAYYLLKSICVENSVLYYVRQNPNSITRKFNSKKIFDLISIAQDLDNYKMHSVEKQYQVYYNQYISLIINSSLYNNGQLTRFERECLLNFYNKNKRIFFNMIFSKKIKYVVEGLLFFFFSSHILDIYNLFKRTNK